MSSPELLPFADAMAALTKSRDAVDVLHTQLALDLRRFLRPLGFSVDSTEWRNDVRRAMANLNREYRHDVKGDIADNGRKIRKTKGLDDLVLRVLDVARKFTAAEKTRSEFIELYQAQQWRLTPPEKFQYDDMLKNVEGTMHAFEGDLARTRERLATYTPAFRILEQSSADLRAFLWRLDNPVSQRPNIRAARPLLARLAEMQAQRREFEQRSGSNFVATTTSFIMQPIAPEALDDALSPLADIAEELEKHHFEQVEIFAQLKTHFDTAGSTPSSLTGLVPDTMVAVSTLRDAGTTYAEIADAVEIMNEIYEWVDYSISCSMSRLKSRMRVNKIVLAM